MTVRTTHYPVLALVVFATIAVAGCSLVTTDPAGGSVIRTGLEAQDVPSPCALVRTWNIDGNWGDVDIDVRTGAIYALRDVSWDQANQRWTANVSRIGRAGQVENEVEIGGKKDPPTMLKVFRGGPDSDPGFVTAAFWRDMMYVHKSDGTPWWNREYPTVQAVRIADLEGDGTDEILVATLSGGVWVQSAAGDLKWRAQANTSVHCVAFLPPHGESAATVVARYSGRSVAFLDTQGQLIRTTRPPIPFSDAESRLAGADTWEILGAESQPPKLLAMSADGTVLWRAVDGDKELRRVYMAEMAVTADGRWVALAMKGGIVRVYDASNGRCVASARVPFAGYPSIVWTRSQDGAAPCIIMASAAGLQAFELRSDEPVVHSGKPGELLPSSPDGAPPALRGFGKGKAGASKGRSPHPRLRRDLPLAGRLGQLAREEVKDVGKSGAKTTTPSGVSPRALRYIVKDSWGPLKDVYTSVARRSGRECTHNTRCGSLRGRCC